MDNQFEEEKQLQDEKEIAETLKDTNLEEQKSHIDEHPKVCDVNENQKQENENQPASIEQSVVLQKQEAIESQTTPIKNQIAQQVQQTVKVEKSYDWRLNCCIITQTMLIFMVGMLILLLFEDIQLRKQQQYTEAIHRRNECKEQFELNRCERKLPAQREFCSKLDLCMMKALEHQQQNLIEIASIFGSFVDEFVSKLSFTSMAFSMGLILILSLPCGCIFIYRK